MIQFWFFHWVAAKKNANSSACSVDLWVFAGFFFFFHPCLLGEIFKKILSLLWCLSLVFDHCSVMFELTLRRFPLSTKAEARQHGWNCPAKSATASAQRSQCNKNVEGLVYRSWICCWCLSLRTLMWMLFVVLLFVVRHSAAVVSAVGRWCF